MDINNNRPFNNNIEDNDNTASSNARRINTEQGSFLEEQSIHNRIIITNNDRNNHLNGENNDNPGYESNNDAREIDWDENIEIIEENNDDFGYGSNDENNDAREIDWDENIEIIEENNDDFGYESND